MDIQKKSVSYTNVPKNVTEKDLRDLFGRMGRVVGFRLKQGHKGGVAATNYGEVDYVDIPTAENAAKQLNGYALGDKKLRVAHGVRSRKRRVPERGGHDDRNEVLLMEFSRLQRSDYLKNALRTLPVEVAYEAVEQLRILALERPEVAEELLKANPQLTAAAVLILQHSGNLPQHLPAEAFSDAAEDPSPGQGGSEKLGLGPTPTSSATTESAAQPSDDVVLGLIEQLGDEELEEIVALTDEELQDMEEDERAQLALVRDYLLRAAEAGN